MGLRRTIAFLPWLHLAETVQLGQIRFVPFVTSSPDSELAAVTTSLPVILSGYRDVQGQPVTACTVSFPAGQKPGEDLAEQHVQAIQTAAALLCLAALAENDYCSPGAYVNSSPFQPYFQCFTEPVEDIALQIRRRDGRTLVGGYKHGEIVFTMPVQCSQISSRFRIDKPFAEALGSALACGSSVARRLVPALAFFNLANTDSEAMSTEAEVILSGAAFEQLLDVSGAGDLACEVGELLRPYGAVEVDKAVAHRPGIMLGVKYVKTQQAWVRDAQLAQAQKAWFLHQKWAEELHHRRSVLVHGQDPQARTWGWDLREHLVMGGFVFPLLVKLCLAREGRYSLTENDECRCAAIDPLLARSDWFNVVGGNSLATGWRETIRKVRSHRATLEWVQQAWRQRGLSE